MNDFEFEKLEQTKNKYVRMYEKAKDLRREIEYLKFQITTVENMNHIYSLDVHTSYNVSTVLHSCVNDSWPSIKEIVLSTLRANLKSVEKAYGDLDANI